MASTANRFIVANVSEGKGVETDNYETSALLYLFPKGPVASMAECVLTVRACF
jgi:hypothetical protein